MLIRCLNSIYLQAPYVKNETDIQDLLQYSLFWYVKHSYDFLFGPPANDLKIVGRSGSSQFPRSCTSPFFDLTVSSGHHDAEETFFFPEVEKITKEKGIMEKNIEQHHAFYPGMEAWAKYTTECMKKESSQKFNAAQFKKLIDGFAPQLVKHLGEEIPTLLALDKYDIAAVKKAFQNFDKKIQASADVVSTKLTLGLGLLLTRSSGASTLWEWGMLIGLMRGGTTFLNYPSSCRTWYIMYLGGSIEACGGSILILCLGRRGHFFSCRRTPETKTEAVTWMRYFGWR